MESMGNHGKSNGCITHLLRCKWWVFPTSHVYQICSLKGFLSESNLAAWNISMQQLPIIVAEAFSEQDSSMSVQSSDDPIWPVERYLFGKPAADVQALLLPHVCVRLHMMFHHNLHRPAKKHNQFFCHDLCIRPVLHYYMIQCESKEPGTPCFDSGCALIPPALVGTSVMLV